MGTLKGGLFARPGNDPPNAVAIDDGRVMEMFTLLRDCGRSKYHNNLAMLIAIHGRRVVEEAMRDGHDLYLAPATTV